MKNKIKIISSRNSIREKICDEEIFKNIKSEESIFYVDAKMENQETNPLLDIELALRRCERVGVFRKQ